MHLGWRLPFHHRCLRIPCHVSRIMMSSCYIFSVLLSSVLSVRADSNSSSDHRTPSCDAMRCLNGGVCIVENNVTRCRCSEDWTGHECQFVHIEPHLNAAHEIRVIRSNFVAAASVGVLIVIVTLISLYVFIRYLRKKRLYADRWIKASADELYRRPFDGKSSVVVVSVSRMNSIRRAAANNSNAKDAESATAAAATVDNRVDDQALTDVATPAVDEEKPLIAVTDATPPEVTC